MSHWKTGIPLHQFNHVALSPERSVAVQACAGSGKTWLLVSRIIRLLLAGARPGEILAITFTRKAAREMAARLRAWLHELATCDDEAARCFLREREVADADIDALLPKARSLYELCLTADPPVTVTTFHSWFLQLLRHAPLEGGALGDASLLEQTTPLISEAWERLADNASRNPEGEPAASLIELFRTCGESNTRRLLESFLQRRADWWAYVRTGDTQAAIAFALDALREEFRVDVAADPAGELLADDGLTRKLRDYTALLGRNTASDQKAAAAWAAAQSHPDAARRFEATRALLLTADHAPRSRKPSKAQCERLSAAGEEQLLALHVELCDRVVRVLQALRDLAAYRFNAAGIRCGAELIDAYQSLKRERQAIDYGDIEWHAWQLVTNSEHAEYLQYKLDARYRHILLDEFQDTNPLQWLTLQAWLDAAEQGEQRPGVFVVGDPKQSIYRFRRAEARLFDAVALQLRDRYEATLLSQDQTRRCPGAVIDVVNEVFLEPQAGYEGYEKHTPHYPAKTGRVVVLPLVGKDEDAAADAAPAQDLLRNPLTTPLAEQEDSRREREAEQLVSGLAEIVGHWKVAANDAGTEYRPARYRDVMLLVRQRTHLATYEAALRRAGIPYITSRLGGLLDTLEARDLTALLEFLVAPFADLKLAHVLKSPIFSCSDEDLAALALARVQRPGSWWQQLVRLAGAGECSAELARAHRLLDGWLASADALPVHDQLDRIYFEADVMRRYAAAVPPSAREAVRANLEAFMQRALDNDGGRYPSLQKFLFGISELRSAPAEEAPDEGVAVDTLDAVRILTVHGAKGLQAPVVWILDAAGTRREQGFEAYVDWPPHEARPVHFSLRGRNDLLAAAQIERLGREAAVAAREDNNLLYVAMTRAQDALIVSGCDGRSSGRTWYSAVREAMVKACKAEDAGQRLEYGQELASHDRSGAAAAAHAAGTPALDTAYHAPMPTGVRVPDIAGPGVRYGTAFHAAMEALTSGVVVDAARLQRQLGLNAEMFAQIWQQAQALRNRPELARFFDASVYRSASNEVSYVDAEGELRRIDRLVEFDDEVWVIDYKTGEPPRGELAAAYDAQIAAYCAAMQQTYGKPVKGMLVYAEGPVKMISGTENAVV